MAFSDASFGIFNSTLLDGKTVKEKLFLFSLISSYTTFLLFKIIVLVIFGSQSPSIFHKVFYKINAYANS